MKGRGVLYIRRNWWIYTQPWLDLIFGSTSEGDGMSIPTVGVYNNDSSHMGREPISYSQV